ncbi:MAG: SDR family NAD(P)-dependent oxidoreductase [Cyanobacteria bacterium P01_F01_bin.42]
MSKTILITGATDGIGLETAEMLVSMGHHVLLHGRNPSKLADTERKLAAQTGGERVESYLADLSSLANVAEFAIAVTEKHDKLDVLINNAGVYNTDSPVTQDGLDVRFVVNAIAPYVLTQKLLPLFGESGRVLNVSSAAQSPVDLRALAGEVSLVASAAYAQSKLAMIMWSRSLAQSIGSRGPSVIAVNPGSLLGSKMVKQAFGIPGGDIRVGAKILTRLALEDEFADVSGEYFDNDLGRFNAPHADALDAQKVQAVVECIENIIAAER